MNSVLKLGFLCLSILVLSACSKDKNETPAPPPTPPIEIPNVVLGTTQLTMQSGTATEVTIQGGNGTYQVTALPQDVVSVTVQNGKVLLQGQKAGTATLTFTSGTKNATLVVTVNTLPIILGATEIIFLEVLTAEVTVEGGTGKYQLKTFPEGIVSATVQDSKIQLKGIKKGTTTLTVSSGGAEATLNIELLSTSSPSKSEGIYKNGEPFFVSKYSAFYKGRLWLAPEPSKLRTNHIVFYLLENTVKIGDVITVKFESKGYPELDGKTEATGKILFIQKNGLGNKAYVKSSEYIFVVPIKE